MAGRVADVAAGSRAGAGAPVALLLATALGVMLISAGGAGAADLGYAPRGSGFAGYGPPPAPPPFAFAVDPRCAVVPMPELDLVGDTARFRATAVCQSRGLYTDSLIFPGPPALYRGYSYGREP
jgi:hypothetical protein